MVQVQIEKYYKPSEKELAKEDLLAFFEENWDRISRNKFSDTKLMLILS
jgi:hypothetical protein